MEAFDFIKKELPDVLLAKLDFDVVLSKRQVVEKISALEPTFGGMAVHYENHGRRVEIIWSKALQEKWADRLNAGQKVRYIQKNSKGQVMKSECREGVLSESGVFWVVTDRCVYADFGEGSEAYDITHIEPAE